MLQKVQKNLTELNMVSPGEHLLVGVSGGADSVCLLLLLHQLKGAMGFSLEAVHVEHGIRGDESLKDASFVERICRNLDVPCCMETVDVPNFAKESGMGLEEAARVLRYQVFSKLAHQRGAKVALAHHMEDNAETILFQLARGCALTGLCGMQPVREDEDGVVYIRPLLSLHRKEIEMFLQSQGQAYCTDSTNAHLEYSRNLLRQMVLPQLEKVNAKAIAHINETAYSLREVKDFIEKESARAWQVAVEEHANELYIDCEALKELHPVLQKDIFYRALSKISGGKKDIVATHVESLQMLCMGQSGKEMHFSKGVIAKKDFQRIRLFVEEDSGEAKEEIVIEVLEADLSYAFSSGKTFQIALSDESKYLEIRIFSKDEKTESIPKKPYTKWLDYDKIKAGFCIRNRECGDYLICDAEGHRKKLKQYFIEEKISVLDRDKMWLLAQDHLVLWLIGGRISEHMKVTDDTTRIVELTYKGGNNHEC